jgi:SAM-dependent methyltransferase
MEKLQQKVECLLCGGQAVLTYKDLPGYKEPDLFNIYECQVCDTSFSLPQIDEEDAIYELIYKNVRNIPNYYRYWHYAENVLSQKDPFGYLAGEEEAYWSIKEALDKKLKATPDTLILEIGCGLGYLTFSLNKAGYRCTGLDISEEAIKYARSNYGSFYECSDIEKFAATNPSKFDIIILTEVLEHVKDIKSFLAETRVLLKKGGKIILTTPNKSLYKSYSQWFTELPPIHSYWLSEASLKKCGELINMRVEFLQFKGFYKNLKHTRLISLLNIKPETPTFNKHGDIILLPVSNTAKETGIIKKTALIKKIIGARFYNTIRMLYYSLNRNYLILGKKGYSLSVILHS